MYKIIHLTVPCNSNSGQNFKLEITLNYFFELELSLIQILNNSETYFELDSEEATVCTHCGNGFIVLMYVYRAFNTCNMTNKLVKYNLIYWLIIILFLLTPST